MTVEITITYARSKQVEVPAELVPDKDWVYHDREKFNQWVSDQADALAREEEDADWVNTEAYETENWDEVYSVVGPGSS